MCEWMNRKTRLPLIEGLILHLRFEMGPRQWAWHQREGDIRSPIALPNAPAFGSADIAIGMLFGMNLEVKDREDQREG